MKLWASVRWFGVTIFRRSHLNDEMEEELRAHIRDRAEDLVRSGLPREEAERRARLEFGGYQKFKEEAREAVGTHLIETIAQDMRFGLRMLRKSPGFTAVAVLTLALGIGANTAVFSIVNAVLLRPLPFKDSSRILSVYTHTPLFPLFSLGSSWPAFEQIRSQAPSLEDAACYVDSQRTMTGQGSPAQLSVTSVSERFFEELGTTGEEGRLLTSFDAKPGQNFVAVLSDAIWRTRFGADPAIVGRTLILDAQAYTVIGVASRGFSFPEKSDVWVPLTLTSDAQKQATYFMLQILAKRRGGQKVEQVNAELATIAQRLVKEYPALNGNLSFTAEPLLETRVKNSRAAYFVLLGASTLVLLISCANLASLLLARGSARQREMALRAALGASRRRLLRQGLVESCLIALGGGGIGALLASGGVDLFRAVAPADTPRLMEIRVDGTLLAWSLFASLFAGVLFGLAPARRAARTDPGQGLKESSGAGSGAGLGATRTAHQLRLGNALVVVEIALAFILLIGSALMARTVYNLLHENPGFRTDHLLSFNLPGGEDLGDKDESFYEKKSEDVKRILERIRAVPGVEAVAASDHGVLTGMTMMHSELRVDGGIIKDIQNNRASARYVSPGYFRLLGVPLLRGREFTEHDTKGSPKCAIVNETMARAYWGTVDVVGKRISLEHDEKDQPKWDEIVGVVADTRDVRIASQPVPEYYLSLFRGGTGSTSLIARTLAEPEAISGIISREIWAAFPDQPVTQLATMSRTISESVGNERLRGALLVVFASIGFALALIGAYGVVSYSVARRIPEIGIRMALGATPREVLRMILGQGFLLAASGVVLGAGGALALTRVIASQLYGVKPTDATTFVLATALVLLVACLACFVPARRAMRVDPMVALRYE